MAEPTGWFPVFTLLLGYATKWFSDWVQHRRTLEREREARRAVRHDALAERRTDFQRQTLLELQQASLDVTRSIVRMNHLDEMEYRRSGNWHPQPYPDELDESFRTANALTSMLLVRVRDSEARELAGKLREAALEIGLAESAAEARASTIKLLNWFEKLQECIGAILSALDEEDSN